MKEKKADFADKKRIYLINISILIVAAVVAIIVFGILNTMIEWSIWGRVTDESKFLAAQQAELMSKLMDEQFSKASTISCMVENGLSFSDERDQAVLNQIVQKNELCMLAYADKNGDVTTYQGEVIGNIEDRAYFSDIISGKKEYVCQYLPTTGFGNEPRIIFSTAVYQQGEINGVLFFSKEITVLRDNLFQQSMFRGNESSLIINSEGDILVKNKHAEKEYAAAENIYDIYSGKEEAHNFVGSDSGSMVIGAKKEMILSYSAVQKNDWYLVCLIKTDVARRTYAKNLVAIRRSIILASVCYLLGILYFISLIIFQIKDNEKRYQNYRNQYERILGLLEKMKCMVLEYDLKTEKLTTNSLFDNAFGYNIEDNFFLRIQEYKKKHPEFDFDGLVRELRYAINNKVTTSFDSIYCEEKSSYKMLSIVMMPIINSDGRVLNVLGSVRETSAEHRQLKEKVDMFNQIPGGTHRCYLSYPIHIDYTGEKLCKMLGYTEEEFEKEIGNDYTRVIVEEDKKKFTNFLYESADSPGVRKCQYKVCCKNGEILSVLDTMESIRNSSGIMYGYSVVVDVSEYDKRQNIIRQEMKQLEKNLEMMRIENSTSQMQPHFLYNALSSIREVIIQDPQYASDLLYDFTVYLRACIRTMQNGDLISILQEIDNIRAYTNIEKMRMGDRLNVLFDIQSEEFEIVPLSIQPLVENAIRHGIFKRGTKGGTVRIETKTLMKYNVITVSDDGVGFDYQKIRNEVENGKRDSIGLDNAMYRLKKRLNAKVVTNSEMGKGTVIKISIPRETEENSESYRGGR